MPLHRDHEPLGAQRGVQLDGLDDALTVAGAHDQVPAEVGQAFGLKKPPDEPKGLGTIQPAPPSMRRAYLIMALVVMLALVLVQGVLWYRGANLELLTSRTVQAGELAWQDHLVCFTQPTNLASKRVMEKVGFVFEREGIWADLPHIFYRLTVDQWRSRR